MPIFYSQSSQPRSFDYQQKLNNPPLELKGTSKRVDPSKSSMGSWDRLMEKTFSNAPPRSQSVNRPDTKRTIIPDADKENVKQNNVRASQQIIGRHPGSLTTLFEKTGDDNAKYDILRKNKRFHISQESNKDAPERRIVKAHPLKKDYDYSSQITTLPITNTLREEKREPSPKRTNSVKEKYDYSSAIPTLPGYFNKRPDSRDPPQKPKEELIKRFALTTEEIIQIKGEPQKYVSPRAYKNQTSQSELDLSKQLNPLSKPIRPLSSRDRILNQSTDEYFGIQHNTKKGKPPVTRDLFRSNFEFI